MTENISLKQARKMWRQYQQALKDAAYWDAEGYEVDGFRLGGCAVADDYLRDAEHLKARFDRIMLARSQRNRKPTAGAVKVAENAR